MIGQEAVAQGSCEQETIPLLLSVQGGDGGRLLPLTIGVALLSSVLIAAFNAVLHSYSSVLWTLAYERMRDEG